MKRPEYNTITIEAAKTGWIVKEKGKPADFFARWDALIRHIELRLTNKGDKEKDL